MSSDSDEEKVSAVAYNEPIVADELYAVETARDVHYLENPVEDFASYNYDGNVDVGQGYRARDFAFGNQNQTYVQATGLSLSRHASVISNISRLRSRNVPNLLVEDFTHKLAHVQTYSDSIVSFDGLDDPFSPLNWTLKKKWAHVALYGSTTLMLTFSTSCYASGMGQIGQEFHVSEHVSVLGIALMMFGFAVGPLIWAPLSELYGRKYVVCLPYIVSGIMAFGTATAKDIQTVLLTRFFAGFFGASAITSTGGLLADLFPARNRAYGTIIYTLATTGGPTLGPVVGGAVVSSKLGWRWTEYLSGILMLSSVTLSLLLCEETYAPVLLVYKARKLRLKTGNWSLHAKHEEWEPSLHEMSHKYLIRPIKLLCEPICALMSLYCAFVYGFLYANLASYQVVFQQVRGWNDVVGSLPFLALLIGVLGGAGLNMWNQGFYIRAMDANNNRPVPEARLPSVMIGASAFTIGLFIFAWTSMPYIHWMGTCVGSVLIGMGYFSVFQGGLAYLVDTYTLYGASANAVATFMRSAIAGFLPIVIQPMYHNLGTNWATTVFACLSAVLLPVPFLFYRYGKQIRARGPWSRLSV